MTKVCVSQRRDADGIPRAVTIPDHVDVLCEMACGAQAHLAISAVTGLAPKTEVWLFGSEGTLHYTPESLEGGTAWRINNCRPLLYHLTNRACGVLKRSS